MALTGGLFVVPLGGTSYAAVTCTYNETSRIATVVLDEEGDVAEVARTPEGAITVNDEPCGAATVDNTDTVTVDGGDLGTAETAIIDINNGGFPGVQFNITAFFELGTLIIEGTPGKDEISVGRGPIVGAIEKAGVDLDGDLEADVSFCLEPAACEETGYID
ncbi:MAG TPA: hypothetical protein VEG38_16105, partial [Acidimicrobiia bacterium]|nr:hypothetical protein [Acidimicrobiia bacterium]